MPDVPYGWRAWNESDLAALARLDTVCEQADGAPAVPGRPYHDLFDLPNIVTRCAVTDNGEIVGAGWVHLNEPAVLRGKVHPLHRRRGIGRALIDQLEAAALKLGNAEQFIIRNEALNAGSEALYASCGYSREFIEGWMRRDLHIPLPSVPRIQAYETWTDHRAPLFYSAYRDAFAERISGEPVSAEKWISDHTDDSDFRPALSLLALVAGEPAGFITTFITGAGVGFIGQVGSRPRYRGRGIAAGLIVHVMEMLEQEGIQTVDLHVNINNPHAIRLYERLGFVRIGQRGKYSKTVKPSR